MYATFDNFRDGGFTAPAWGEMSTIAHETLKSPVWGMCVGWVVFACFSNCGGKSLCNCLKLFKYKHSFNVMYYKYEYKCLIIS